MKTVTWLGESGKSYVMAIRQFGESFHGVPGVYLFCKAKAQNDWAPIYIGESKDLSECLNASLTNHPKFEEIKRNGASHVCAIRVDGSTGQRRSMVSDLLRVLNPVCNRH